MKTKLLISIFWGLCFFSTKALPGVFPFGRIIICDPAKGNLAYQTFSEAEAKQFGLKPVESLDISKSNYYEWLLWYFERIQNFTIDLAPPDFHPNVILGKIFFSEKSFAFVKHDLDLQPPENCAYRQIARPILNDNPARFEINKSEWENLNDQQKAIFILELYFGVIFHNTQADNTYLKKMRLALEVLVSSFGTDKNPAFKVFEQLIARKYLEYSFVESIEAFFKKAFEKIEASLWFRDSHQEKSLIYSISWEQAAKKEHLFFDRFQSRELTYFFDRGYFYAEKVIDTKNENTLYERASFDSDLFFRRVYIEGLPSSPYLRIGFKDLSLGLEIDKQSSLTAEYFKLSIEEQPLDFVTIKKEGGVSIKLKLGDMEFNLCSESQIKQVPQTKEHWISCKDYEKPYEINVLEFPIKVSKFEQEKFFSEKKYTVAEDAHLIGENFELNLIKGDLVTDFGDGKIEFLNHYRRKSPILVDIGNWGTIKKWGAQFKLARKIVLISTPGKTPYAEMAEDDSFTIDKELEIMGLDYSLTLPAFSLIQGLALNQCSLVSTTKLRCDLVTSDQKEGTSVRLSKNHTILNPLGEELNFGANNTLLFKQGAAVLELYFAYTSSQRTGENSFEFPVMDRFGRLEKRHMFVREVRFEPKTLRVQKGYIKRFNKTLECDFRKLFPCR